VIELDDKLHKPARALVVVSIAIAVVFAVNHRMPVLAVVGTVIGFAAALFLASSGEKAKWVWAGLFLNVTGIIGMYTQKFLTQYAESLRGSPFLDETTLEAVPMAAYLAPTVLGGLAALLLKSNLPDSQMAEANIPSAKRESLDVVVGTHKGKPIVLKHNDRYLHTLVVGTTGTGKTSRVLKPLIWQDLQAIK